MSIVKWPEPELLFGTSDLGHDPSGRPLLCLQQRPRVLRACPWSGGTGL